MDYNTWFAEGNKAKGDWQHGAQAQQAYEAYKYAAEHPGQGGGMLDQGGYEATGDPTGMRAAAKQLGMSEDFGRFSNATLMSWEKQKDTNCPPNMPYQAYDGSGCIEKPIDSNRPGPGAGGGGGGGGVGAGGGAPAAAAPAGGGGMDAMTEYWKNLTMQSGSRYSPEAMAALEADQFSRARAQEKQQLAMARQEQAQRGVARSANQLAATRQIGVGTGQQIMANRAQIQRAKIDADYQDMQAAIKNAMDWVNSMRDYMLRGDMNAIQREQIAAQIRLASMNINAQKQMIDQQHANQINALETQAGLSLGSDYARQAY